MQQTSSRDKEEGCLAERAMLAIMNDFISRALWRRTSRQILMFCNFREVAAAKEDEK
jgi:hypothetical protein